MTVSEIRQKFIKYFESKGHTAMPSSSLVPKDDTSVLLTTAGMQQFKKWFSGEIKPPHLRTVTIQKCVRTNDIDDVGDETHLTFFEMLGNFSFGDYFKKEAIEWGLEFIEKELGVDKSRIWVSIFAGDKEVPRDDESEKIWRSLGITDIREFDRKDNFWGPTGTEGPCGPTSEIYVDDVEVWNLVFNEFYMQPDGVLLPLPKTGIDTGAGLERVAATINRYKGVFQIDEFEQIIDSFSPMMKQVGDEKGRVYSVNEKIIADHLRTATFLLADGVRPSNLGRGYVLRRLIRRAIAKYMKIPGVDREQIICSEIAEAVIDAYGSFYPELRTEQNKIISELDIEEKKFRKTLVAGLREFDKIYETFIGKQERDTYIYFKSGERLFDLFQTYGFPYELSVEELQNRGVKVNEPIVQKEFDALFAKHQEVSRGGMDKKFAGGMENKEDPQIIRYHTAAHLLGAALRVVLGEHAHQKGSNITAERLRFDFSQPEKLTDEEKQEIEDWVNDKISQKLTVNCVEVGVAEAKSRGAEGEFTAKYGDKVKVYTIGGELGDTKAISSEICGGPHVQNTSELGRFKLGKEESSSAGVRRIKATLE